MTKSHVLWSFNNGPDVPTPVTDGTYLYSINDRGIMYCLDAKTGKTVYGPQRLRRATYSASPVLADGKIYITDEDGVTSVVQAGPTFEVLAENDLGEYTLSSPAMSEGQIFLRTDGVPLRHRPEKEVGAGMPGRSLSRCVASVGLLASPAISRRRRSQGRRPSRRSA